MIDEQPLRQAEKILSRLRRVTVSRQIPTVTDDGIREVRTFALGASLPGALTPAGGQNTSTYLSMLAERAAPRQTWVLHTSLEERFEIGERLVIASEPYEVLGSQQDRGQPLLENHTLIAKVELGG